MKIPPDAMSLAGARGPVAGSPEPPGTAPQTAYPSRAAKSTARDTCKGKRGEP